MYVYYAYVLHPERALIELPRDRQNEKNISSDIRITEKVEKNFSNLLREKNQTLIYRFSKLNKKLMDRFPKIDV